jgi:hypothetical protein
LGVGNAAAVSAAVNRDELLMGASSVAATARVGELLTVAQHPNAQSAANAGAYRRYMLWAALLLAVGSLAAIAWRLARGVQHAMPRGDDAAAVPGAVTSGFANAPAGASDPASAASASSLDATNPMTGSSGTSGAEVGRQRDGRD